MEPRTQIDRVRIGGSRAHRRGGAGRPQGLGDLIGLPGGRVPVGVGPPPFARDILAIGLGSYDG